MYVKISFKDLNNNCKLNCCEFIRVINITTNLTTKITSVSYMLGGYHKYFALPDKLIKDIKILDK